MPATGYPLAPLTLTDERQHRLLIATALNNAIGGRLNITTTVTLRASATTTTIVDPRIGAMTVPILVPQTADAASALASVYYAFTSRNTITLTHASSANIDQTFGVVLIG